MSAAVFFSTGRCGTQWLAKILADISNDMAVVCHEPLRGGYCAKRYLRSNHIDELLNKDVFYSHVVRIKNTIQHERYYIETGWPCYAAIPLLYKVLDGNIKLIHIVRNPVHASLSMATHRGYMNERIGLQTTQ